jgi:signal transduction histidine kinase
MWNTTHYEGPFVFHSITRSVLSTQLYIAVAALSTLCIAALVSERKEIAVQLDEAADSERRRIERNLHDGAQQRLVALAVHLNLAADVVRQAPEQAPAVIAKAEADLHAAFDELRELVHGTHPPVLMHFGLAEAIGSLAARSTVPVEIVGLPTRRFPEQVEATAYYVLSEAMTNAQKYAQASPIRVEALVTDDALHVQVSDDGVGGASEGIGSGLHGLRQRVEGAGGRFLLESRPGRGTRVAATIPLAGG